MKTIRICPFCSGLDQKELAPYANDPNYLISIGCINQCSKASAEFKGKIFGLINQDLVVCDTKEAFIECVKQ